MSKLTRNAVAMIVERAALEKTFAHEALTSALDKLTREASAASEAHASGLAVWTSVSGGTGLTRTAEEVELANRAYVMAVRQEQALHRALVAAARQANPELEGLGDACILDGLAAEKAE